jgi:sorting nexin-4
VSNHTTPSGSLYEDRPKRQSTPKIAKPMIIHVGDAQKHLDSTQGAYITYLVTTTVKREK